MISIQRRLAPRRLRFLLLTVIAPLVFLAACGGEGTTTTTGTATTTRGAAVARPTIEGPVSGGAGKPFLATTTFDLGLVGYEQAEYFISGTATAYANDGAFGVDGKWKVTEAASAAYKTRIVVYRPIDAEKFNGTVVVEWLNVSGGVDAAADWIAAHVELVREGSAWVGVSAQIVGVEGGTSAVGLPVMPLKEVDPARYGSLVHPGDSFSYDIYSQAGQAIRRPSGPKPLGDLAVQKLIAAGDSQSAFRLTTYIDAIHPVDDMYDGFLVHSRGTFGITASLAEAPQPVVPVPGNAKIRDDLNVPVLTFETETDLTLLGFVRARQDDSDSFRLWEVAGASHADIYTVDLGASDLGDSADVAKLVVSSMPVTGISCVVPINSGPHHFVLDAAFHALRAWIVDGTLPPIAPRLQVTGGSTITRDANGNGLGGIRTPQIDVPIAAISGEGQVGSILCLLFGTTVPFDAAKLATLYPTHDAYVAAFDRSTDEAVAAGFLLAPDAALLKEAAATADVGA